MKTIGTILILVGIALMIWLQGLEGMKAIGTILILVGIALMIWLQGLRRIVAAPPHVALVTILGKRVGRIKKEGWRFFLFRPFIMGFIEISVEKKNLDFAEQKIQKIRTPDFVELEVPVSITYTPDRRILNEIGEEERKFHEHIPLIEYLNSGGEKGVNDILEDIVRERLRIWAIAETEGPQSGEKAMKAQDEAVAVLIKAIAGATFPPIPFPPGVHVPTVILLKYYAKPQIKPDDDEKEKRGPNWEKVDEELNKLSPEQKQEIKEAVEKRRGLIQNLRRGNGVQPIPQLGIILNRLNVGEIKPLGKWAEALELESKEDRDRIAETVELTHIKDRINELKEALRVSNEQALEILQTERGKVKKEITEKKLNVSEETRKMIENILPKIIATIAKGGGK